MFVITIGGIIIHMMNVYLRTRVSSIILLKDQKHCQIKTLSLFGNFQRPMLLENIKTDSLHSLDMSNEFSMVLKKAGAGPINIEELAASMKSEDVNKLMNTGSLKLDVKGLKYKLDVDKSGDFSDINLFNTLFDKKY